MDETIPNDFHLGYGHIKMTGSLSKSFPIQKLSVLSYS